MQWYYFWHKPDVMLWHCKTLQGKCLPTHLPYVSHSGKTAALVGQQVGRAQDFLFPPTGCGKEKAD